MGRWAYYSPLWLGFALGLLVKDAYADRLPASPVQLQWAAIAAVALLVGVVAQIVMVGVQGAFAQVLPVPAGRTIRGEGARLGGWCILVAVAGTLTAGQLFVEGLTGAGTWVLILAGAVWAGAIVTYVWNWPVAARDFEAPKRTM